ncbi:Uncharacterized protein TCM_028595 [Theobroma cacao]|uniref:Secreted protein n=1 Tax=Theobroma cacao TaxID=3641 RepID=A0A061GBB0_THECC|nr:Uncharacterized protein TCM_028595 [Theobroma cacao]
MHHHSNRFHTMIMLTNAMTIRASSMPVCLRFVAAVAAMKHANAAWKIPAVAVPEFLEGDCQFREAIIPINLSFTTFIC